MVCKACGFRSCLKHGIAWHENMTCEAYDDSHPDDLESKRSMKKIRAMAKRCPTAGCGFFVEKDGHCDHMVCSRCKTSWLWGNVEFEIGVAS